MSADGRQRRKDEEEMTNLRKPWVLELAEYSAWCWESERFWEDLNFLMQVGWQQRLEQQQHGMHGHGHKVVCRPSHHSANMTANDWVLVPLWARLWCLLLAINSSNLKPWHYYCPYSYVRVVWNSEMSLNNSVSHMQGLGEMDLHMDTAVGFEWTQVLTRST